MPRNTRSIDAQKGFPTRACPGAKEDTMAGLSHGQQHILTAGHPIFAVFDNKEDTRQLDVPDIHRCQLLERKRRLTTEQVRSLETSFEKENKLEPERKNQLAEQLGLHPRQVAIWFQNRRARSKTKQLELDYTVLRKQCDSMLAEKERLVAEVKRLQGLLEARQQEEEGEMRRGSKGWCEGELGEMDAMEVKGGVMEEEEGIQRKKKVGQLGVKRSTTTFFQEAAAAAASPQGQEEEEEEAHNTPMFGFYLATHH